MRLRTPFVTLVIGPILGAAGAHAGALIAIAVMMVLDGAPLLVLIGAPLLGFTLLGMFAIQFSLLPAFVGGTLMTFASLKIEILRHWLAWILAGMMAGFLASRYYVAFPFLNESPYLLTFAGACGGAACWFLVRREWTIDEDDSASTDRRIA